MQSGTISMKYLSSIQSYHNEDVQLSYQAIIVCAWLIIQPLQI